MSLRRTWPRLPTELKPASGSYLTSVAFGATSPILHTLYESRAELLNATLKDHFRNTLSGPWFIAHVKPRVFKILAVERTEINLHDRTLGPCGGTAIDGYEKQLAPTALQQLSDGDDVIDWQNSRTT